MWARGTPSTGYAGGWSVAAQDDGSVRVTGDYCGAATFGAGETNETVLTSVAETCDIFVARYDEGGRLAWVRSIGGTGWDYAGRVAPAPDGGLRVTGMFAGQATFGAGGAQPTVLTSAGTLDGYVANYDAAGALIWVRQIAGEAMDSAVDAVVLDDGSTILLGSFTGAATLGLGQVHETALTADGPGDPEIVAARYGPDGSLVWAAALGGVGADYPTGLVRMPDDTVLVAGGFQDRLTVGADPVLVGVPQEFCAFFARLDADEAP
jgi:hypothetical protein